MTLLVITPDYASHAFPMMTIADAWRRHGRRVIVATGPAMAPHVIRAGMEYTELIMSRGSNAGVLHQKRERDEEARSLSSFFAATRRGMVATLRYQSEQRATDLLWRPEQVARRVMRIVETDHPRAIMVDHLAFAATIGLRALEVPYGDVVLGHPTALPVGEELYGVPEAWPPALAHDAVDVAGLRAHARSTAVAFTADYNDVLRTIRPAAPVVGDAFASHGDVVLYNYPAELHDPERTARLPRHVFLGSAVRNESADSEVARWLALPDRRPLVVVSFGTFLSARVDVLARVAAALRRVDARVAIAIGDNDPSALGGWPQDWLVRATLPQVALLPHADVLITHGGNNSITEALTFGVPMVVMPFSTDQFDGAAAVERSLAGVALDPNRASRPLIAGAVRGLLRRPPLFPSQLGQRLRDAPGPDVAYAALMDMPPITARDGRLQARAAVR